jgi:hypothetical protein
MSAPKRYDCRLGEDFRLNDAAYGLRFSSVESGFIVVDDAGALPWKDRAEELTRIVQATSRYGLLTVVPWWPNTRRALESVRSEFGDGTEGLDSLAVTFEPTVANLESAMRVRENAGGSGEWGLGGTNRPLRIDAPVCPSNRKTSFWNLTTVLCQADALGCYLYFGEQQSVTFFTRVFDGVDRLLQSICS